MMEQSLYLRLVYAFKSLLGMLGCCPQRRTSHRYYSTLLLTAVLGILKIRAHQKQLGSRSRRFEDRYLVTVSE